MQKWQSPIHCNRAAALTCSEDLRRQLAAARRITDSCPGSPGLWERMAPELVFHLSTLLRSNAEVRKFL